MILNLDKKEVATMVLHMHIMRCSFKKLIKVRYSRDKENMVQIYDYILESVKKALTDKLEVFQLNLNIKDSEVLNSFLIAYTEKLHRTYKEIGVHKVNKNDYEQLKMLENIQKRLQELIYIAYV